MEISLASNGATLSYCDLTILGELAGLHDFNIVVDEINDWWTYKEDTFNYGETKNLQTGSGFYNNG